MTPVRLNPTDLDLSSTREGPKMKALVNDGVNTIKIKLLVLNMVSSQNQKHTNSGHRNQIPASENLV